MPCRTHARLYRRLCHSTLLRHIATQWSPSSMIQFLYRDSPLARTCARARAARPCAQTGRVVAHVGRVVGPCCKASWPCRGHPTARPNALSHDTMHCIVTKAGKWAVAHLGAFANPFFFFFTHHFFSFVPATIRPQKKIYIFFMSSVEPNKVIIIYFIYFFPILHTVKP